MKGKPYDRLRNLSVTQAPGGTSPATFWEALQRAAVEKGALDPLDLALIQSLARHAGRPGDLPLLAVAACLLSSVKAGGLRIPVDPAILAARLEIFFRGLLPSPDRDAANTTVFADATSAANAHSLSLTEDFPALSLRLAGEFDRQRIAGAYEAVIGAPPAFLPLLCLNGGLYFQKHQAAEAAVGARLGFFLNAPDGVLAAAQAHTCLDTVLTRYPLRLSPGEGSPAMEFDPRQKVALALALRKRLIIISGGPGTGKTSLAANLLRAWTRARRTGQADLPLPRIRLAAPTGRAAQRLAESLRRSLESIRYDQSTPAEATALERESASDRFVAGLPCETLHSLLRYNPGTGEYFHQRHRPLPADLVLVDEVSMVDIFALARLLEALDDDACLVLMGDMDQLPSVEAGSVLAELVPSAPTGGAGENADAALFSPDMREWLSACFPEDAPPFPPSPATPPAAAAAETAAMAIAPAHPLHDHLILLERSHRSEASILQVTRRINAMDGEGALDAMGAPLVLVADPSGRAGNKASWPALFMEQGRKVSPEGGCRLLLPPDGRAQSPDYRRGWDAWLAAWIDFHYLSHSFAPALFPGRTLSSPRQASYASHLETLCAFRFSESGTSADEEAFHAALAKPLDARDPLIVAWLQGLAEMFAYLDQARILTLTRKGWHGSVSVNRRIADRLRHHWDPRASAAGPASGSGADGFNGAPIIILENDYAKGLFNGDVGILLRIQGRSLALFRRADGYKAFPAPFLPRHETAFAMTVHKSQGSEYDQVLLLLPEAGNRLLYKETLYTAITRARYFAGIYGPREVFLEAAGRKVIRE